MGTSEPIRLFRHVVAPDAGAAVAGTLASDCIGEGPRVAEFERELAPYVGENVAAVSSGTAALWLAYTLAGIKPGDAVLTTPLGCLASTETLLHFGARIVWADVDPETGMLDPHDVSRLVRQHRPRAIVGVDWGGALCDWDALWYAAEGATLIEDAAHAFGADRATVGAVPDFTAYSFQAIKMLTTGDGGALVCRHAEALERARLLRWFGLDRRNGASMRCTQSVREPGFKFQMNDIAAAIGLANLRRVVPDRLIYHRGIAGFYDGAFLGSYVVPIKCNRGNSAWLYTVRVPDAQLFISMMAKVGIECGQVHARNDVQPMFAASRVPLPGMDALERTMVCLPIGPWLTADDVERVATTAKEVADACA